MKIFLLTILILIGVIFLPILFHIVVSWLIKLGFLKKIKINLDFLDHEMQKYGRELEQLSYKDLKELAKQKEVVREVGRYKLVFFFEPELENNEDLFLLINMFDVKGCNTFGVTPTYTFWKRKDNSVYHGEDLEIVRRHTP